MSDSHTDPTGFCVCVCEYLDGQDETAANVQVDGIQRCVQRHPLALRSNGAAVEEMVPTYIRPPDTEDELPQTKDQGSRLALE